MKYLGCEIYYENEKLLKKKKLSKFSQILGILNYTLNPALVQKFSSVNIYTSLALLILLYEREIWEKSIKKKIDITLDDIVQKNSRVRPFYHKRN